jgi:hypothetical protein
LADKSLPQRLDAVIYVRWEVVLAVHVRFRVVICRIVRI